MCNQDSPLANILESSHILWFIRMAGYNEAMEFLILIAVVIPSH